jgi:hypothetical protein
MAKKIKRIRYRTVRVWRPLYQSARAATPTIGNSKDNSLTTQARHNEPTDKNVKTQGATIVNSGPVATFDPDNNPYAYMVSQLPAMLGGISDLLSELPSNQPDKSSENDKKEKAGQSTHQSPRTDNNKITGQVNSPLGTEKAIRLTSKVHYPTAQRDGTEVDNKATEQISYQIKAKPAPSFDEKDANESSHSAPSKDDFEDTQQRSTTNDKPSTPKNGREPTQSPASADQGLWVNWHGDKTQINTALVEGFKPEQTTRPFLWPGLPEKSCRLIRFGGNAKATRPQADASTPSKDFISSQLTRLSEQSDLNLPYLMLFLSSVNKVKQFIIASALKNSMAPCLSQPLNSLQKLTVQQYFDHAIDNELISAANVTPACVLAQLRLVESQNLPGNLLHGWFRQVSTQSPSMVVQLSMADKPVFVELCGEQVQLYGVDNQPVLLHREVFLSHLQRWFECHSPKAMVPLKHYQKPGDLPALMTLKFESGRLKWQRCWPQLFKQFVTLSDSP